MEKLTQEEWKDYLKQVFPDEILGFKRPAEGIATDLDFSTNFPQFISKDPAYYLKLNAFLRQGFSNDKVLNLMIDEIKKQLANCDLRLATQILKGLMSADDKKKLDGIAEGATKYSHPTTHPATMITQDSTHRFVTDTEKTIWNSKADGNHGNHVPKLETADNSRFLRNDGTFQTVTPEGIGAAREIYSGTIKIEGDASKFYPVAFNCPAGSDGKPFQINIRRHMNDDAQNRGYLDFEMTGIGSGWGGCPANIFTRYYGNAFIADAKPAEKSHLMHVWLKGQNSYKWGGTHQIVLPLQIGDSVTIQNDTLTSKTEVVLPKGLAENGVSIATVDKVQQLATADVKTVDWNTLTTPGLYSVGTSSSFTAERHQPVGSYVYGILQVLYTPNGYRYGMVQIYYPHAGTNDQNRIRYRTGYGGTWNDEWKTLPNLDDVSSVGKGIVASSLGETGWAKYANGLIEQWGYVTIRAYSTETITLPIEFNSAIYNIQTTVNYSTVDSRGDKQDWVGAYPASLNTIAIRNGFEHNISSSKIWWRVMGV